MTIRLLSITLSLLLAGPALAQQASPADRGGLGGQLYLSLTEAQDMALENNLGLDIARSSPLIASQLVGEAEGVFDPLASAEWQFNHDEIPVASPVQLAFGGSALIKEKRWSYSTGINGILPFGLAYSTDYNFERADSNSGFAALEPAFRPTWRSELTLPLLRGLIDNPENVAVKRSKIGQDISDQDFRAAVMDLVLQVEINYWGLAAARAQQGVAEKSLATARDLLEQTRVQYEVGVVSRVNVTEADAGVAEREGDAIQATNDARAAHDVLLDTIAVPSLAEYQLTDIVLDTPAYIEYDVDEDGSVEMAMAQDPELIAARKQLEDAKVQLRAARNDALPRLDLTTSYSLTRLDGRQKVPAGVPTGTPPQPFPDLGLGRHSQVFPGDENASYGFGARASIPLGNRTARRRVTQREIELRRTERAVQRTEQQILLRVRVAAREVNSARERLEAAERRRAAADETLRAEEERLRLGDSTPFNVLQREEDVSEAETQQIEALQRYRVAIAALERFRGSILEERGISAQRVLGR
jgi:outer membrane protein